eukprot:1257973-Lingulodinium_polyedra.AAC.1
MCIRDRGKPRRGITSLKELPAYRVQNIFHVLSQVDEALFVNNPHEGCQRLLVLGLDGHPGCDLPRKNMRGNAF